MNMKKLSLVDFIIVIGVVIALFVGLFTAKHFRQTADKQIEATSSITFQVFLRGVTITGNEFPIKNNDKTFVSIRNVPYTQLEVVDVNSQPRKTFSPQSKNILVLDPSQIALYDAIITVKDVAKITKDGAVVGGNKIKIGLPIVLEGDVYKFNGTVSDVRVYTDTQIEENVDNSNVG